MSTQQFSASTVLSYAWDTYRENAGYCNTLLLSVELVCFLAAVALAFNTVTLARAILFLPAAAPDAYLYPFLALYAVIRTAANVVIYKIFILLSEGRRVSPSDVLAFDVQFHLPMLMRMMIASVFFAIYSVVGLFILILPGVAVSGLLRFYRFLIVDQDCAALESLRRSVELSGDHKVALVQLNLSTLVLRALGLAALVVGFVPATAVSLIAETAAYRHLSDEYFTTREPS